MKESTYIFNEDQCTLQDGTHILLVIQMLKKIALVNIVIRIVPVSSMLER